MLLPQFCSSENRYCPEAVKSATKIAYCPESKKERDSAARRKNCSELAAHQNCTTADKFMYHCVIDGYGAETMEVCAPRRIITGSCTEFNVDGGVIQRHLSAPCNDTTYPKCDRFYSSEDAYKYPDCYQLVYNKRSSDITSEKTKFGLLVPIGITIAAVVIFACVLFFWRKRHLRKRKEKKDSKNEIELQSLIETFSDTTRRKTQSLKRDCNRSEFEDGIKGGRLLRDYVKTAEFKRDDLDEKMQDNEADTTEFLKAYNKVNETFVETKLTRQCTDQLEKTGVVVLTGKQGSGKTLTSVHIMKTCYEDWTKRKYTSWKELLTFEIKEKTLVYIDNIFDGYIYRYEVQKWWNSLCYFYFEYIRNIKTTRLLITAKDNAIAEAFKLIETDSEFIEKRFFVKVESFPLSFEEKKDILTMQEKLAKEVKKIPESKLTNALLTSVDSHSGPIGFPLCAHLYAFEKYNATKGTWILDKPRDYVRMQISNMITEDKTNDGVKTLFLILLFYHSPDGSKEINLKYKNSCEQFWINNCSREMSEKLKPLNFENLYERAAELEYTMLIPHATMYEFQHQLYLEGVIDYFFSNHPDVAIKHFPLDLLRAYEFECADATCWKEIIHRLVAEMSNQAIPEALGCKIFQEPDFQEKFYEELLTENKLDGLLSIKDTVSSYNLPVMFWANKYGLKILSELLWKFVEENKQGEDLQFYLARFGECCEKEESFITHTTSQWNRNELRDLVCQFRLLGDKSILHVIVYSDKSDHDAHRFITKILKDAPQNSISVDIDLLYIALTHTRCSRLLCILKILDEMKDNSSNGKSKPFRCKVGNVDEEFWELEWVVRICIILANEEITQRRVRFQPGTKSKMSPRVIKSLKAQTQSDMVQIIEACIKEQQGILTSSCENLESDTNNESIPEEMSATLKMVINKSVRIQSARKLLTSNVPKNL